MQTRGIRAAGLVVFAAAVLAGCGEDDFENEPRPPVPVQITGVITEKRVTVSPNKLGAGPIELTISNQTAASHIVVLEGTGVSGTKATQVEERVGPINPADTATIQKTLQPGKYEVKAGSERAVPKEIEIEPAKLVIGTERPSSKDTLLLP